MALFIINEEGGIKMRLSNRLVSAAFTVAMVLPATVSAVAITIDSGSSWSLGSGWAAGCAASGCDSTHTQLNMSWTIDSGLAGYSTTLTNLNDTFEVNFGAGTWSEEDNSLVLAETDDLGITGILKLSVPTLADVMNVGITGTATKASLSDSAIDLTVAFDPVIINFGTTGQLTVQLSAMSWDCNPSQVCVLETNGPNVIPGSEIQTTTARFTLTKLDTNGGDPGSVPEPGVLLLMGAGLMGLGLARRRKSA